MASKTAAADDNNNASYLAQPSGPCCWLGTIHHGTPRGAMDSILDVPTYIARPAADKANGHVVFYFPDIWGMSNNALLLMDGFADAGFLTLGMDYFRHDAISKYRKTQADPLPEGFDLAAWRNKHFAFATETIPAWTAAVKARFGTEGKTRYACTAYCFGAPFVCSLLAQDDGIVSAGAVAHPTALKEEHFEQVKKPILLSCGANDTYFTAEARTKALEILEHDKKRYHMQLFQGVGHGFAVKGDPADPYQRWCKEQSLRAMADWFHLCLVET